MKKERETAREGKLLHALQLPDDLVKGNTLVSIHGQERLWIENFRGISSYTPEEIRLITKHQCVTVTGAMLEIVSYTKDEIEIAGRIQCVSFAGPHRREG